MTTGSKKKIRVDDVLRHFKGLQKQGTTVENQRSTFACMHLADDTKNRYWDARIHVLVNESGASVILHYNSASSQSFTVHHSSATAATLRTKFDNWLWGAPTVTPPKKVAAVQAAIQQDLL